MDLLVSVAITGDGPPLPRATAQCDSAVEIDLPAPNRTEALAPRQSARDYNQGRPRCLAKSKRRRLNAKRRWRWYARCQTGNRSTHRVADPDACAERVKIVAATIRANYRGSGTGATDRTGGSRSAAALLDDRSAAGSGASAGDHAFSRRERGGDAARFSMHLFGAGNLDRMGGHRVVVELCAREPGRARAMCQLHPERKRAVAVHTAGGIHRQPATADDLQRYRVHATRAGEHLGGAIFSPATLDGCDGSEPVHAMCLQLTRASR